MSEADELRRQRMLERRFRSMGLDAGVLPGGRAVVATLPLGPEPFDTPEGPRVLKAVRFYTIGHDRIKCMAPRALFHLPPIRVLDCEKLEDLEARIRSVWSQRLELLRDAGKWLDGLGIVVDVPQGAPQWCFSLGLDDKRARAAVVEPNRVILPSRGPLSGLALADASERVFVPDANVRSSADLEIAVTVRLEALARRKRDAAPKRAVDEMDYPAPRTPRGMPLLLVGSRLAAANGLQESLRLRGFEVTATTSAAIAVELFHGQSYELVFAETRLDRGDGIELVPALRAQPGVLDLPVVLFDERGSDHRRAGAKAAGASGYLSGPLDAARVASALAHLASERRRRRFARFERALSVSWPGSDKPAVTIEVGRGGCLVRGAHAVPTRGRFALHLPETGKTLHVEADVLYRLGELAPGPNEGTGLRFHRFDEGDEAAWIDFLTQLEQRAR
jgi:two-component system chemotaxis response regulator CheY